jgi:type IV pilus assembly protein PilC
MHVARFAEASSILIKGGVPVAQAVEISGHTVGNLVYRETLREASNGVREGELLSQVLAKHADYFPPLVSQMVAVGETTGQLDEMFSRIASFFSREVNSAVDNLVELIQPVLMIFIGTLVGLLFASILLPIYNLAQAF